MNLTQEAAKLFMMSIEQADKSEVKKLDFASLCVSKR
jgi:hypothetical protein